MHAQEAHRIRHSPHEIQPVQLGRATSALRVEDPGYGARKGGQERRKTLLTSLIYTPVLRIEILRSLLHRRLAMPREEKHACGAVMKRSRPQCQISVEAAEM
jgi:hypothetical protein